MPSLAADWHLGEVFLQMKQADTEFRQYVQQAAGSGGSVADELTRLAELKERGVITDEEFQQLKAKALASA